MTGWVLRLIVIILVLRALWRLLSGVVEGATAADRGRSPEKTVSLVRDPVCGTYVTPGRALSLADGAGTHFFCSERCRTEFRQARRGR